MLGPLSLAQLPRRLMLDFRDFFNKGFAFNRASGYAIRALDLPVRNALEGVPPREFYAPGSLFAVDAAPRAIARGR